MIKVSNEELTKINEFIAGCNDMINGKFILAEVKITKILNMIAGSEELYRYITECMNGFDFVKEYHRAEMKNGLNNGVFSAPQQPEKLVAFVFCLLVECDSKRVDFYSFINDNFISKDRHEVYAKFANTLLVPFRDTIANHFGMIDYPQEQFEKVEKHYESDLQNESPFGEQNYQTTLFENVNYDEQKQEEVNTIQPEQKQPEMPVFSNTMHSNSVWDKIPEICDNIKDCIAVQRHMNDYLRDELNYLIETISYSVKYHDAKITSALVTAFDEMSHKFRQIQFVFGELKNEIQNLYK